MLYNDVVDFDPTSVLDPINNPGVPGYLVGNYTTTYNDSVLDPDPDVVLIDTAPGLKITFTTEKTLYNVSFDYGRWGAERDLIATDIEPTALGVEFRAHFRGQKLGPFRIRIPGVHNVSNALAAIGVALELEVAPDLIRSGLAAFSGVERRFQIRGEKMPTESSVF